MGAWRRSLRNEGVALGQIASPGQLRMSLARWALLCVPLVLLLGTASGALSGSGADDPWYAALDKPSFQPPGWAFGVVWPILYALMGLALAIVINARGSRHRKTAIALFVVQLALNLAWSPLFFAGHQVTLAFWWILLMIVAAVAATWAFSRVRTSAALLLLPYLAWLCFAATLNFAIDQRNPDAETLAPNGPSTQIRL